MNKKTEKKRMNFVPLSTKLTAAILAASLTAANTLPVYAALEDAAKTIETTIESTVVENVPAKEGVTDTTATEKAPEATEKAPEASKDTSKGSAWTELLPSIPKKDTNNVVSPDQADKKPVGGGTANVTPDANKAPETNNGESGKPVEGTTQKPVSTAMPNNSLDKTELEKVVASYNSKVDFVDRNGNVITDPADGYNIPETANSFPYLSMKNGRSKVNVGFEDKYNYQENEYFLKGNANIYKLVKDGKNFSIDIVSEDNEYINRVIVFMPETGFSGEVFVDILNASSKVDVPDLWRRGHDYFMRNGHAYVGITSKKCNVDALKKFDKSRYNVLSWKANGSTSEKDINAMFYDMLGQLGVMLSDPNGTPLLCGDSAKHVYLMGQSQSGWYTNTYSNSFGQANYIADAGDPVYDGIINVVGGMMDAPLGEGSASRMFAKPYDSPVPFILFVGENDYNPAPVKEDADEPGVNVYRHYMIAGGPHSKKIFPPDPKDEIGALAGRKAGYDPAMNMDSKSGKPHTISNFNMDSFFNTALDNMVKYVADNTNKMPAGNAPKDIPGSSAGFAFNHERDEHGNVSAGIVSPQLSVPVASYYGGANNKFSTDGGSMVYFDKEKIDSLYSGKSEYLSMYEDAAMELVNQGYLLEEELEAVMQPALNTPVFDNRLSYQEFIDAGMSGADTTVVLKKTEAGEGFKHDVYLMRGDANIYTVLYADQPIVRKKNQHFKTPIDVYMPDEHNGETVIGLRFDGKSAFDPTELMNKGVCYIELAADPAEAAKLGGNWKVLSDKVASVVPSKEESGLLWDIISQTASHLSELTGQSETTKLYLGVDADDAAHAYTYEAVFNHIPGYLFDAVGYTDSLKVPKKLLPLCSMDKTVPVETLTAADIPQDGGESDGYYPMEGCGGSAIVGRGYNPSAAAGLLPTSGSWLLKEDGNWSFIDQSGNMMRATWIVYKNQWYYLNANGIMVTGWNEIDGNWYYFSTTTSVGYPVGALYTSTYTPDNYFVDQNGVYRK